ncbi:MAG TPA: hypothetical protein VK154_04305 [Chitinophagales bacterium]|nr:hypothetical protein [Chitinophagales bacterium]
MITILVGCKKEKEASLIDMLCGDYFVSGKRNTWSGQTGTSTPIDSDVLHINRMDDSVIHVAFRSWNANFKYYDAAGLPNHYSFSTVDINDWANGGTGHDFIYFPKANDSVSALLYSGGGVSGSGYFLDGIKIQ